VGDLVTSFEFSFARPRGKIPSEMASVVDFLQYLGLSPAELKKIWWFQSRMYRHFDISKRSGKVRVISAPDARLKMLQRKIAALLNQLYRPRNPVHGFCEGRSVKTNAEAHWKSKYVVNLDIKSFFPTITENRVKGLFLSLGIDHDVATVAARLCCNAGMLPQGAPSSPVISNMICFSLDKHLLQIAKRSRCIYTRYADDITFSSYQPPALLFEAAVPMVGRFDQKLLASGVIEAFQNNGFDLNGDKCHFADRHSRRTVTGLRINEMINVDRRFVRNIRAALFQIEKSGISAIQAEFATKYKNADLLAHIKGKIAWLGYVKGRTDPVYRGLAERFNGIFPNSKIVSPPTALEKRDRAVWIVEHFEGNFAQGTAFFVESVGLVTAWHCVQDAATTEVEVYHPSKPSNRFKAKVQSNSADRDLALLSHTIPPNEFFELKLSSRVVAPGYELTALGYPSYGPGDNLNVRTGTVTSLPRKHGVHYVEVTQKLAQGMSGGPILDEDLGVVGIVHKGGPDEARDLGVHVTELKDWLGV
jgi:RNA-directed DNA polymerase